MPHLFVDISSHGFGHLAQVAPILNQLVRIRPELRLTIRSGLPLEKMRTRIAAPFEFINGRSDFGFVMLDAVRIDQGATAKAYRAWHENWPGRVAAEAEFLRRLARWALHRHGVAAAQPSSSSLPLPLRAPQ